MIQLCMEKIDARKLSTEAQQQIRNQSIRLRKSGKTYREISEITGVHLNAIAIWCKAYQRKGAKAIQIKKRGRRVGDCRTLTLEQEREIQKTIYDKFPDQLKFPFALWTRKVVQQLIKQLCCFDMPVRTVGEYLRRWGFTTQKPVRRAYKQNPKAINKWLNTEYPEMAKRAIRERAEIHWGDEAGLCNDSYHGRSYAPKGQIPAIRLHPMKWGHSKACYLQ